MRRRPANIRCGFPTQSIRFLLLLQGFRPKRSEVDPPKGVMERFVLGEFRRGLDDRFRLTIPGELADFLPQAEERCTLAKERPGALSLWLSENWKQRLDQDVELIHTKMRAGHLKHRIKDVQVFGRLLSTRHREIQVAGRGRITLPEGFRDFLGVEPGGDVVLIGAAVCVEIWNPTAWIEYLREHIAQFGTLVEDLAG